ncbi:AAA family ATPase [Derxia gummosa]|uniref:AAA family ATPase n=1 Tax=Derxia gummosa DSM 723 TaxID=1121388 RepID=A0A8B6XBF3_9BURK|nr:AAA family ATPase [Derxia gummosa]
MIVVVGAEKGGVGKTAIATNLAALATKEDIETILLDTDSQGSATAWIRIRNQNAIKPPISLLTVHESPANELNALAAKFELVIVDVGAQNYRTMLQAATVADLVLVPTGPDQLEVESAQNVFEALRAIDPRHKRGKVPAFIVPNLLPTNTRSREEVALREFLAEVGLPVFDAGLRHRTAWRNSRRDGLAVHELTGRDACQKSAAEMRAVFDEAERRAGELLEQGDSQ